MTDSQVTPTPVACAEPKKLKILFLDIDGVINSTRSAVVLGLCYPYGLDAVERMDPIAVGLIRKLCSGPNVSIVLSSTWRKRFSAHDMANALDLPIIGVTDTAGPDRGDEIARWLHANADRVECYAIVDDDDDMWIEQRPYFVQTNPDEGLTWRDYLKLCDTLKVRPDFLGDKPIVRA